MTYQVTTDALAGFEQGSIITADDLGPNAQNINIYLSAGMLTEVTKTRQKRKND